MTGIIFRSPKIKFFLLLLSEIKQHHDVEGKKNRQLACRQVELRNVFSMFVKLDAVMCF